MSVCVMCVPQTHTHKHNQIYFICISSQTSFLEDEEKRKLLLAYQWHLYAGNKITLGHTSTQGGTGAGF